MPFSVTDVDAIFAAAVELSSPEERAEYVRRVCGESAELRQRVDELLAAHFAAGDFLEPPNATVLYRDDDVQAGPGTVIGPYKLLQQIGEGGMGVVFMAEQSEPINRTVALKIIKPGMDTQQVIARFEAERQALAMMDHPSIAKVLDAGTTNSGRPYFVMELVKGVPITKYCDEKQFSLRQRLELIKPVCEAVQHAHQKGIIHRDLKPTNVLVAEYDNRAVPKVIDFGVAKATAQKLTERTMFTEFGQVIGTFEYMSPEQAKFNQLDIDTRSDIYSLGVLLYELLTGSTPFERERLREAAFDEVLRIIREEEPPRPSTRLSTSETLPSIAANRHTEPARLSKDVSGELDWVVMKCLEKDRARRYESASALAADVMHYLADEPVRACPPSAGYRLKKFMRRNKVPVAAAAAILVLLVAGVTVSTWQAIRIKAEQKNTLAQKKEAERQRAVAEQKQKESEAVLEFINSDVFAGATPERMPDLKVRDEIVAKMLAPAAKLVRERFKDQPLAQAAVMHQIALSFQKLGRLMEAAPLFKEAMELRQRHLGHDNTETITAVSSYGLVLRALGRPEAEGLLKDALERRRRLLGENHPETLVALRNYANVLYSLERYEEAEPLFQEALERRRRLLGEDHLDTITSLSDYAFVLDSLVRLEEGESLHKEVLERRRRLLGENHPETLHAINGYAYVLGKMYRSNDAEPLYKDALARRRSVLGDDHPDTLTSMQNYAAALKSLGRYADAEKLAKEALERRRRVLGDDHRNTIIMMVRRAELLRLLARVDEALPLYREVMQRRRKAQGDSHSETLSSIADYARLLQLLGREGEAEPFVQEEIKRQRAALLQLPVTKRLYNPDTGHDYQRVDVIMGWHEAQECCALLGGHLATVSSNEENEFLYYHFGRDHVCWLGASDHQEAGQWAWVTGEQWQYQNWISGEPNNTGKHASYLAFGNKAAFAINGNIYYARLGATWDDLAWTGHWGGVRIANAICEWHEHDPEKAVEAPAIEPLSKDRSARLMYEEDVAAAREGVAQRPESAHNLNMLAWLLATGPDPKHREKAQAVALAKQATEMSPKDGNIWNTLGVAHYRAGAWQPAIEVLNKSMKLRKGGDSADWFFLAMAHWQLGHKDEAGPWYDKAVEWMEQNQSKNEELLRFRAEATELLGITEPTTDSKSAPPTEESVKAEDSTTTSSPTSDN